LTYDLFTPIIALSEAEEWKDAVLEWRLVSIGYDQKGTFCICTHFIKEVCYIENVSNGNRTIVGNHCISQFRGSDLTSVFRALSKGKVNPALIAYAFEEGIITPWERDFMNDTWRKRKFVGNQKNKFDEIKRKIYRACRTRPSLHARNSLPDGGWK